MRARNLASVALLVLGACQTLPEIPANTCGNHAIEAGEDCDGFSRFGAECRPPGRVGECHLDCSTSEQGPPQCPDGFGCDQDGVCRRPTGRFDSNASMPVPGGAFELASGDFDGDGRDDVLTRGEPAFFGLSSFSIHYFDRSAALEDTWTTTQRFGSATVASLSNDDRSDLLFSAFAFGAVLGERNRTLTPYAYPSFRVAGERVVLLTILDRPIGAAPPLLVMRQVDGSIELERPTREGGERLVPLASIEGSLDAIIGEPTAGPLFDPGRSSCDALGLALQNGKGVSLYDLCKTVDGVVAWHEFPVVPTELPFSPPATASAGPIFADLDGNGQRDVLIMTDSGPYAALHDGETFGALERFRVYSDDGEETVSPIAAGDFTGDGVADLIAPTGLVVSQRTGDGIRYRTAQRAERGPWVRGLVADVNADGQLDAIAATRGSPGIDLFLGTESERQNPFLISTPHAVDQLSVGDFDADGTFDLAFVMPGRGTADDDQISIAYGARTGAPEAPVPVAHTAGITQLVPVVDNPFDTRADLLVTSDETSDGSHRSSTISILIGSADRSLFFSPVVLSTFSMDQSLTEAESVSVAAGHFVDPSQLDAIAVAVVGLDSDSPPDDLPGNLWLLPAFTSGQSSPRRLEWDFAELKPVLPHPIERELAVRLAAMDLDGDGLDEVILAAPIDDGTRCLLSWASVTEAGTRQGPLRKLVFEERCRLEPPLAVRDIDGDGASDIAILTGVENETRIQVLWNDGLGDFSQENSTIVANDAGGIRAFAFFRATAASPLSLAYATVTELHLLESVGTQRAFVAHDRTSDEPNLLPDFTEASGITAADVNGDGVTDLVVADSGAVRVLPAELELK